MTRGTYTNVPDHTSGVLDAGRAGARRSVVVSEAQEKVTRGNGGEPIIRVEDCSVVFGRRAKQALEMRRSGKSKAEVERETGSTIGVYQADFEVYPSEIFVVIGLSGSGKSTLLRAINRLIEPTEGK